MDNVISISWLRPAMKSDDEAQKRRNLFKKRCYACKRDIIRDLIDLNRNCNRPFCVVTTSDTRQFAHKMAVLFVVQFAFLRTFVPPKKFACTLVKYPILRRLLTDMQLKNNLLNASVRYMAMLSGRKIIRMELKEEGISAMHMNCVNA